MIEDSALILTISINLLWRKDRLLRPFYFRIYPQPTRPKSPKGKDGNQLHTIYYICGKILQIMAVRKEQNTGTQPTEQVEERPNRGRYASMFAEDNPDIDFEDKESRYGRMAEEREDLRNLRTSGKKLSGILDRNRWLGAMLTDGETNPFRWMAKHGIDVRTLADDPEAMDSVAEAFDEWTKKQADGESAQKSQDDALGKSLDALVSVQEEFGLSDEQFDRMWDHFWDEIFAKAFGGEVSRDTWLGILHAMNYDTDIQNAREEAAIQARNEKHTNKLKTFDEEQVPPSFNQGQGQSAAPKKEKKESITDFIKKYS